MVYITVSIVLYKNDRKILLNAIESVLKSDLNIVLYLVDNSPTDELKDIAIAENVIYVHNPSNPGFGAAHNLAIQKATMQGALYHLVLNPDVYFDQTVIKELFGFMEDNLEIGNLMPKILYPDGSLQYLCKLLPTPYDWIGRRFNPFRSMVEKRNKVFELKFTGYDQIMEVPYLSGCFMFLRISSLKDVGLFDDGIFMYGEEADLCRRLINKGYKTVYYPKVSVVHHFEKGSHKSLLLTWIGIQSAVYYFNKWGWFLDRERKMVNKATLENLKYISTNNKAKI